MTKQPIQHAMNEVPAADARDLRIQDPCSKQWHELVGDDRKRYCSECKLHVFSSTALARDEALFLRDQAPGRFCMRIEYDRAGRALYLDSPAPEPARVAARDAAQGPPAISLERRLALAAAAGLLAACGSSVNPQPTDVAPPAAIVEPAQMGSPVPVAPAPVTPGSSEILGEIAEPVSAPLEELGDVAATPPPTPPAKPPILMGKIAPPRAAPIEKLGEACVEPTSGEIHPTDASAAPNSNGG